MTAHEIKNKASRFPKGLRETQDLEINEKDIPINTKKATKFGLGVYQGKVLFLDIIVRLNFLRSRNCNANTKQLSTSIFCKFQNTAQNTNIVIFYSTDSLIGIC